MSANRIEILKDCRIYLEKMCLCNDKHVRIANYSVPSTLICILCNFPQTITLSLLMRYVYISNFDLNEVSTAFAICIGSSQLQLIYFSLAANRPTTVKIMNTMQSVVDDRTQTSPKAFDIYEQAEEVNRVMHKKIVKFVIIGQLVTYLPATFVPISYSILGAPAQEEWELPFPGAITNEHTFIGYYTGWFIQFCGGVAYMVIFGAVLSMEIGFCKFVEACYNDLHEICAELSHGHVNDANASKRTLNEAFALHQKILDIEEDLQTILAGSFFYQMVVCAIFLAAILLSIADSRQGITSDIVIVLFCLLLEIQLNYTSCSYAQTITTRSFEVADDFYSILWYKLPCDQQKVIAKAIHQAQRPFYLQGYKFFTCSMETFLAMIRKSYSYYLILESMN